MKNVRKDVIKKLLDGLNESRVIALCNGDALPKRYSYNTDKANHFIYYDDNTNKCYCNSILYDGTKCHTEISF